MMAMSFQKLECVIPSTILPSARSLSATHARGAHQSGTVPFVWSLGRITITRFGMAPARSHSPRWKRMSPAFTTSGASSVQPGYSGTSRCSSDWICECVS